MEQDMEICSVESSSVRNFCKKQINTEMSWIYCQFEKTLTFRPSMQSSMQMSISSILTVRHVEPTSMQVVGGIISVQVPGQHNCTTGLLLLCSAGGRAQVPVPTVGQLSFKEMEASWEVRRHIGSL